MGKTFQILQTVRVRHHQVFLNDILLFQFDATAVAHDKSLACAKAFYDFLHIDFPKFHKMDLMCKWGILCAEILLQHENAEEVKAYRKAIILQNTSSSLSTDRKFQHSIETHASPALFVYTLPNIVMGEIAIRHHFKGENTFFVTPAYDALQLTDYIQLLFENDIADWVLGGFLEVTSEDQDIVLFLAKKSE